MEFLQTFFVALYELSNAMAPYILFGLLFAGMLHEVVPDSIVSKHLGRNSIGSVIKSTLLGIPLPVCSCGVIPLAASIKKSGASNGATLSFLISTPITGIDSILATYGMFGWAFTIYRVLTSMILAMIAGIFTNIAGHRKKELKPRTAFSMTPSSPRKTMNFAPAPPDKMDSCTDSCHCENSEKKSFSARAALDYAFVTLLGDIAKPLVWGLLIGALITVAVPENLSEIVKQYGWLSYVITITIAIPMYVCATASLPIAAGLMLAGVSPGAAFVFLSAGPATNTVTIGIVKTMLGTRSLAIYLGSIIIGSIAFGLLLDWFFGITGIDILQIIPMHEEAGIVAIISSAILWTMVLYLVTKPRTVRA